MAIVDPEPTRQRAPLDTGTGRTRFSPPPVTSVPSADGGSDGVAGNAKLTAANGLLLTVLLAVEGLTILQVRQLITIHIFVGLLLLTPIALKVATTTYRFARYYLHGAAYVRRGPPPLLLRALAPPLVVATVAMMASGVLLLTRKPGDAGFLLTLHKGSFIVWVALMTVHFLAHIGESLRLTVQEWRGVPRPGGRSTRTPRRATRTWIIVVTLIAGVALAAAVTPSNSWSGKIPAEQPEGG